MRWSQRLREEGRDMAHEQAEIRKKIWLSVEDAEILLDLKVDAAYSLVRGPWAGFSKLFGERNWRVHRESLEALPLEDPAGLKEDERGFVKLPRLVYQQLKNDAKTAREEMAVLEERLQHQGALLHLLVEGVQKAGTISEVG